MTTATGQAEAGRRNTPSRRKPTGRNPRYDFSREPWHTRVAPPDRAVAVEALGQVRNEVAVALVVATRMELDAVLKNLRPLPRRRFVWKVQHRNQTYFVGRYGAFTAAVVMSAMGAAGRDGALNTTRDAIEFWHPAAVIMPGIAFGKDPHKQGVADVLVSDSVIPYELQRIGSTTIYRSVVPPSGASLLNRFRNARGWKFLRPAPDGSQCEIHIGPMLSGEKLIDSIEFKQALFAGFPAAIGGEMEGGGLYSAAAATGTEWLVVKAICDWGDGTKHDAWQPLAAAASASLVLHVLSDPTALQGLVKLPLTAPAQRQDVPLPVKRPVSRQGAVPTAVSSPAPRTSETPGQEGPPGTVFISYSRKDAGHLKRLQTYLTPLVREGVIDAWDDTRIEVGLPWEPQIYKAMASARIAVLLISANFYESDFITRVEMPVLVEAARTRGLMILPVIVGHSRFKQDKVLSPYQAVNNPSKPLTELTRAQRDRVWAEVAGTIERAVALKASGGGAQFVDAIERQLTAVLEKRQEPRTGPHRVMIRSQSDSIVGELEGMPRHTVKAEDLRMLSREQLQHIRVLERSMKGHYKEWARLYPKRHSSPAIDGQLRELISAMKEDLLGVLRFLEMLGLDLQDHYSHIRYLVQQYG